MKNNTTAKATTSINNRNSNFPEKEIMDATRKSCEVLARTGKWRMSAEDLDDLKQDTNLKAVMYWKSYDPTKATISTWVNMIATNCYRDALRREMKRNELFIPLESYNRDGDEYIDSAIEFAASGYEADREVESKESLSRICNVVDSLPENQRYILKLHMDKEMKPKQMAEHIGCTANAAATHLHRARKIAKKRFGRDFLNENGIAA